MTADRQVIHMEIVFADEHRHSRLDHLDVRFRPLFRERKSPALPVVLIPHVRIGVLPVVICIGMIVERERPRAEIGEERAERVRHVVVGDFRVAPHARLRDQARRRDELSVRRTHAPQRRVEIRELHSLRREFVQRRRALCVDDVRGEALRRDENEVLALEQAGVFVLGGRLAPFDPLIQGEQILVALHKAEIEVQLVFRARVLGVFRLRHRPRGRNERVPREVQHVVLDVQRHIRQIAEHPHGIHRNESVQNQFLRHRVSADEQCRQQEEQAEPVREQRRARAGRMCEIQFAPPGQQSQRRGQQREHPQNIVAHRRQGDVREFHRVAQAARAAQIVRRSEDLAVHKLRRAQHADEQAERRLHRTAGLRFPEHAADGYNKAALAQTERELDPRDVISHAERRDALAVCGIQRAVQRAQQRGVPVCRRADLLKNASKAVQLASSPLIATLV